MKDIRKMREMKEIRGVRKIKGMTKMRKMRDEKDKKDKRNEKNKKDEWDKKDTCIMRDNLDYIKINYTIYTNQLNKKLYGLHKNILCHMYIPVKEKLYRVLQKQVILNV